MPEAVSKTWLSRSAACHDATQAMLDACVLAAGGDANGVSRLSTATARFDSVASTLEQDLTALATAHGCKARPVPCRAFRMLAKLELNAVSSYTHV